MGLDLSYHPTKVHPCVQVLQAHFGAVPLEEIINTGRFSGAAAFERPVHLREPPSSAAVLSTSAAEPAASPSAADGAPSGSRHHDHSAHSHASPAVDSDGGGSCSGAHDGHNGGEAAVHSGHTHAHASSSAGADREPCPDGCTEDHEHRHAHGRTEAEIYGISSFVYRAQR